MKKAIISSPRLVSFGLITFILVLVFPMGDALAKFPDDLPGPEIMPDSSFYFLKLFWEKVVLFFTFGAANKAEKYTTFAEKRAYEAKEMLEEGKKELADKAKESYKYYLNKALEKLEAETQKAIKYRTEEIQRELEQKVEQIKNKLKEVILW